MSRAQDLMAEAITLTTSAEGGCDDAGISSRLNALLDRMKAQEDKFFFKSLAGVPLANKAKKAAQAIGVDTSASNVDALDAIVAEIEEKADAPGTVLT